MAEPLVIAVDAMGGDHAPAIVVEGVAQYARANPELRFLLCGQAGALEPLLAAHPAAAAVSTVRDCADVVPMDAKPAQWLRRTKGTSMWGAINAVKAGEAGCAVSAGSTGVLMALSLLQLRTMRGVHRPALAALWPTAQGFCVVLDVGANVDSDPEQLLDFAVMGEAYHRALTGVERPTVGLLNVGSEDMKGHTEIREAAQILREFGGGLNFTGFVEGDDISMGATDVVVTDGFTGNVALKTAEGAARLVGGFLKEALTSGPLAMAGALIARNGLLKLKDRMDPRSVNGGVFLGLNGLVIKSHGGTDGKGFASALGVAARLAHSRYLNEVAANLSRLAERRAAAGKPEPALS
jgi:glycerol-3-phosphate acyltransferase PlsX